MQTIGEHEEIVEWMDEVVVCRDCGGGWHRDEVPPTCDGEVIPEPVSAFDLD